MLVVGCLKLKEKILSNGNMFLRKKTQPILGVEVVKYVSLIINDEEVQMAPRSNKMIWTTKIENWIWFRIEKGKRNSGNHINPLNANFKKWSNTLKQFVGKLPTNCLSVFDHFVGLVLKGLTTENMFDKLLSQF